MRPLEVKLNVYFALLTGLAGLTFAGSPELGALPLIAVFFALFGLLFVDLLRWFALPPAMAYVALGAIAIYTINRFLTVGSLSPEPQLIAVSELLVLVQAVLMLQRKNRRIYEQLAVFALLELIVAAIFNNALSYGLLLIPLGVIGLGALSLLHIFVTGEDAFSQQRATATLTVKSQASQRSFIDVATPLPRAGMLTVAPATLVVAFVFFYALPRTRSDARSGLGSKAQVGFSTHVRLGQIGRMMVNPEIAARLEINSRRSGARYDVIGDLYLRGAVYEDYDWDRTFPGSWGASTSNPAMESRPLPLPPINQRAGVRSLTDEVNVKVNLSPMSGKSLFAVPPYHSDAYVPEVVHWMDRWLIARREKRGSRSHGQFSYDFVTSGFRDGFQTRYLPRFGPTEGPDAVPIEAVPPLPAIAAEVESLIQQASALISVASGSGDEGTLAGGDDSTDSRSERQAAQDARDLALTELRFRQRSAESYVEQCLDYEPDRVPSAGRVAEMVIGQMEGDRNNPVDVARTLERYLSRGDNYLYTLDLTMQPIVGLDPLEQFLSVDRRGNCQHFASAMVLMLRSLKIPARLVVGFNTDEFNSIGGYYVARQLHAHAWVEALIDARWLKPNEIHYATPPVRQYWMRLDPTPGGGGTDRFSAGRVSDVLDIAQDMWTNYVVEVDANDRRDLGLGSGGMSGSYQLFYEWLKLKISQVRSGDLGAGALAGRDAFSWPTAVLTVLFLLASIVSYQFGIYRWLTGAATSTVRPERPAVPSIEFFAELVALLERLGLHRRVGQTAKEFTTAAAARMNGAGGASLSEPLSELTAAFYLERFGGATATPPISAARQLKIKAAMDEVRERVAEMTDSALN